MAEVTRSLKKRFTSQPLSRNSTASQSSSSGCDGSSPVIPKSPAVRTMPGAEELLPEAIHRHARRERVIRARAATARSRAGSAALAAAAAAGSPACQRPPCRGACRTRRGRGCTPWRFPGALAGRKRSCPRATIAERSVSSASSLAVASRYGPSAPRASPRRVRRLPPAGVLRRACRASQRSRVPRAIARLPPPARRAVDAEVLEERALDGRPGFPLAELQGDLVPGRTLQGIHLDALPRRSPFT